MTLTLLFLSRVEIDCLKMMIGYFLGTIPFTWTLLKIVVDFLCAGIIKIQIYSMVTIWECEFINLARILQYCLCNRKMVDLSRYWCLFSQWESDYATYISYPGFFYTSLQQSGNDRVIKILLYWCLLLLVIENWCMQLWVLAWIILKIYHQNLFYL